MVVSEDDEPCFSGTVLREEDGDYLIRPDDPEDATEPDGTILVSEEFVDPAPEAGIPGF